MGAVSALGHTVEANWAGARDGVNSVQPTLFDPGPAGPAPFTLPAGKLKPGYAAALETKMGRRISSLLDPFALIQLSAAYEAIDRAGLLGADVLDQRTAVIVGHAMGGMETLERSYERFFGQRNIRMNPTLVPKIMVSAPASAIAMQFGVHGPVFAVSSACASSGHAIVQGATLVASGMVDVAIVGGAEAIATPGSMSGWMAIQALAKEACRPFSRERDGMAMAEGGAVLVLEAHDHAMARGAVPLAEYLGGAMTSDAGHITQPSREGPVNAMRQALKASDLGADATVLISAHGTGTLLNDRNEAAALTDVFGPSDIDRHPVIATKSCHGHLIGGSGALQAVIAIKAMQSGLAPPILNYLGPDAECNLNLVLKEAQLIDPSHLLLNAFAFGGLNTALVFGKAN